jgi:hypothetical protein
MISFLSTRCVSLVRHCHAHRQLQLPYSMTFFHKSTQAEQLTRTICRIHFPGKKIPFSAEKKQKIPTILAGISVGGAFGRVSSPQQRDRVKTVTSNNRY